MAILDPPVRIPSVWIRNKNTGKKIKVNQADYASDLGVAKFRDWELVRESRGDSFPEGEMVDGREIGIPARIHRSELENSEQLSTGSREEFERKDREVRSKRRRKKQPNVEVVDKVAEE